MDSQGDNLRNEYRYYASYPEIKVIAKNSYYADLLQENYSGVNSEFTGVNQYIYHKNVNSLDNPGIAYHLGEIAKVEQLHLQILAQLIIVLGSYPVYRTSDKANVGYWSGINVCYGRSILEQLECDLELEYVTIKSYNTNIALIADPNIKKILERIVLDEQVHVDWLTKMIKQYTN